MYDYKVILGAFVVILSLASYIPYFRDIFRGKTKPHAFSWFIWGLLTAIACAAQLVAGGGAGAWLTGSTALVCFVIAWFGLVRGERDFPLFDWLSLGGALLALLLWQLTREPLLAIVLITLTDALGFLPTLRKGYDKPYEETLSTWVVSSFKWIIGIIALENLSLTTWLYPAALVVINGSFVILLVIRRRQVKPLKHKA